MRRYRKQAKVAMISVLTMSTLSSGLHHVFAQADKESQENITVEGKEIQEIIITEAFPDIEFQSYISNHIDKDQDGRLSVQELEQVTTIDVSGNANISNLEGISNFTNLRTLYCYNTSIETLDVSKNEQLDDLRCYNTKITDLDVSNNLYLRELYCNDTAITSLDVSKNTKLFWLRCENTGITSLDVSKNTNLWLLYCFNTKITNLDISNNINLGELYCNDTAITSLDVSKNINLVRLNCKNTNLISLDVTNNSKLSMLSCSRTKLAYLNIGDNPNLQHIFFNFMSTIHLGNIGPKFNITEKFPNIDLSKIRSISGATMDATGVISNYQAGTPIKYTYDCGTIAGQTRQILEVTLNFTNVLLESTLEISYPQDSFVYGNEIPNPTIITNRNEEDVKLQWYQKDDLTTPIDKPTNVGEYVVKAILEENENYLGISVEKEIRIVKAETQIEIQSPLDKVYDGKPMEEPKVEVIGSTGQISYTWYQKEEKAREETWRELKEAPIEVGSYKLVIQVEADENHLSAEAQQTFAITEKEVIPTIPEIEEENTTTEEKVEGAQTGYASQARMWTILIGIATGCIVWLKRKSII